MQAITFSSNLSQRTSKLRRRSARSPSQVRREVDSWGPYLPGLRAKDDQKPNVAPVDALPPSQKADVKASGIRRLTENLAISQSSEVDRLPVSIPPATG